jgi:hypothetical protein
MVFSIAEDLNKIIPTLKNVITHELDHYKQNKNYPDKFKETLKRTKDLKKEKFKRANLDFSDL